MHAASLLSSVLPGLPLGLALTLAPASTPSPAPTGAVLGQVVDEDGGPFGFVDVFLEQVDGTYQGAVLADDEGEFTFRPAPVGTFKLYAHAAGFQSTRYENVVVTSNRTQRFSITLRPMEGCEEVASVNAVLLGMMADTRPSDVSTSLSGEFIPPTPLTNRRIQDVVALFAGDGEAGRPSSSRSTGGSEGSREGYAPLTESPFRRTALSPLSTFSVDVDTASLSNVRRFLRAGRLPPAAAVRIEELVNWFEHDDPPPLGDEPLAFTSEVASCPWAPDHRLVRLALKARGDHERRPRNLVFLVDVSGLMRSPDKLPLVRKSLRLLAEHLRPSDRVGLVVYAGAAGVVLEPTGDRAALRAALRRLRAGGSTAGGDGIRRAYDLARAHFVEGGVNRVILATDGDFNVGVSSDGELVDLIEHQRESGIFLTVLGFGTGNLQDAKMQALADHGNGQHAYVDSIEEAERALVRRIDGTLVTVAKDVKVQVEMNPLRVASWRLLGYENRRLAAEEFDDDRRDAGDVGAEHSVVALYEVVPAAARPLGEAGEGVLRYQRPAMPTEAARSDELLAVRLRWKEPDGETSRCSEHVVGDDGASLAAAASDTFRFTAAVASFGELLRGSEHVGGLRWEDVIRQAKGTLADDPHGDRAHFVELARTASNLAAKRPAAAATTGPR